MIGAIAGDIIGSVYEFNAMKDKAFLPLFHPNSHFTDDTVLTVAVADALLHGKDVGPTFKEWGRRYPDAGWGGNFYHWLMSENLEPYNSFGNGAAMRVSPAAMLADSLEEALGYADQVTRVTHNHPEGLKGARATVTAIVMAREGSSADTIRAAIEERFGYDMQRSVESIRPDYSFTETCQETVPEAIICALEACDFEDAVRNAISLGGDADTLAAITGAIAEARFGVPRDIAREAWGRLDPDMQQVVDVEYRQAGVRKPWA